MLPAAALREFGGFATRPELIAAGCWPDMIDMSLYYRKIIRVRRGQYALPEMPPHILRALRVGGRLACVSALAHYAGEPSDELHVLVKYGISRLGWSPGDQVVVHWSRRPVRGTRLIVAEEEARAQAANCRALSPPG